METMKTKRTAKTARTMKTMKHAKTGGVKKVFICSPFTPEGKTEEEKDGNLLKNIEEAHAACRFALSEGCFPYAPHLYFTQFLNDEDPEEREMGIILGLTWLARCDEIWIFGNKITEGMKREIDTAEKLEMPVRFFVWKKQAEAAEPEKSDEMVEPAGAAGAAGSDEDEVTISLTLKIGNFDDSDDEDDFDFPDECEFCEECEFHDKCKVREFCDDED